jgi:hypothetical protein
VKSDNGPPRTKTAAPALVPSVPASHKGSYGLHVCGVAARGEIVLQIVCSRRSSLNRSSIRARVLFPEAPVGLLEVVEAYPVLACRFLGAEGRLVGLVLWRRVPPLRESFPLMATTLPLCWTSYTRQDV